MFIEMFYQYFFLFFFLILILVLGVAVGGVVTQTPHVVVVYYFIIPSLWYQFWSIYSQKGNISLWD